jgi:alpha-ketoglutarate-dependent taurine dioxygenase
MNSVVLKAQTIPSSNFFTGDVNVYQFDKNDVVLAVHSNDRASLSEWIKENHEVCQQNLLEYGAILFRGFDINNAPDFRSAVNAWSDDLLKYTFQSTPRSKIAEGVYTSTEYPKELAIPQHNENSYTTAWPEQLWFYCEDDRFSGGETPLTDSRHVIQALPPAVVDRFVQKQLLYVRNYNEFIDLPWKTVFQTDDKNEVEQFCRDNDIRLSWNGHNLTTKQLAQVWVTHPVTKDAVWFNQAHLFHHSSADPALKRMMDEIGVPLARNVVHGDDSEISIEDLTSIREVYEQLQTKFTWKKGDVLLIDNLLVSHGRNPYWGQRKVLVAMTNR